jgi:hypothetical protein
MHDLSTRSYRSLAAGSLLAMATTGCLSGENIDLGRDLDANGEPPPSASAEADSSEVQDQSLAAVIRARAGTLCAGSCEALSVHATGGGGAYTYHWDDDAGDGADAEEVCPSTTTTYSVDVGSAVSDIMANASLTITVVACDAGAPGSSPDAGGAQPGADQDAETAPVEGPCVSNPSFDGPPVTGPVGPSGTPPTTTPPDWQTCMGYPTVDPIVSPLPALDGKTYVGLPVGSGMFQDVTSSLGQTLCAPLEPGVEYSFCIDVAVAFTGAMATPGTPPPQLEIYGGNSPCDAPTLLWTSPPITSADSWTKDCPDFFVTAPMTNIVLVPTQGAGPGTGSWSYVIIDNIVGGS